MVELRDLLIRALGDKADKQVRVLDEVQDILKKHST